jgi:hypothetical protein
MDLFSESGLVYTSWFFLIPGIYGYTHGLALHGILSAANAAISANYWRRPIEGTRRNADLIVSKISLAIYFVSGCVYVRDPLLCIAAVFGASSMFMCYCMANWLWNIRNRSWRRFYALFHVFVVIEQMIVLYAAVHAVRDDWGPWSI